MSAHLTLKATSAILSQKRPSVQSPEARFSRPTALTAKPTVPTATFTFNMLRLTYFASRNIIRAMISSFKDKDTRELYESGTSRRFNSIARIALRKLDMIAAATQVATLRVPPGNRLEALSGDRNGQWSIRINNQWRICFRWNGSNADEVEIVDYH